MLKDVLISISSTLGLDEDDENRLEFTTDGYYFYDGDVGCLSYMESEVTGMEGTRTSVLVGPDQVIVDRDGTINSRMVFQKGLKSSFQYITPFGTANFGVDTRKIRHSFGENGGDMEIDYVVNMEHAVVTRNKFQISVRQTGEQNHG